MLNKKTYLKKQTLKTSEILCYSTFFFRPNFNSKVNFSFLRFFIIIIGILSVYCASQDTFTYTSTYLTNFLNKCGLDETIKVDFLLRIFLFIFGLFNLTLGMFLFPLIKANYLLISLFSLFNTGIVIITATLAYQYFNFIDKVTFGNILTFIQIPNKIRSNAYIRYLFLELKNTIEYLNIEITNLKSNLIKLSGNVTNIHSTQQSMASNVSDFHNQFSTLNDVVIQHLQEHTPIIENLVPPGTPTQMFVFFVVTSITRKMLNTKKYLNLSIGPTLLEGAVYNNASNGGNGDEEFNNYRKTECGGNYTSQIEKLQEMARQSARTKQNFIDIIAKIKENKPIEIITEESNVGTRLFLNWDSLITNFNQGITHLSKASSNKSNIDTPPLSDINKLSSNQIEVDPLFQTLLQGIDQISKRNVIFRDNVLPNIRRIDKNIAEAATTIERVISYPMQVYETINNMPLWTTVLGTATGAIIIYSLGNYIYANVINVHQQTDSSLHSRATPLLTSTPPTINPSPGMTSTSIIPPAK